MSRSVTRARSTWTTRTTTRINFCRSFRSKGPVGPPAPRSRNVVPRSGSAPLVVSSSWSRSVMSSSPSGSVRGEEGVDERRRIEVDEVVEAFAEADQLDRDEQLALDRDHNATLGRAIEFREHNPGDVHRVGELPRLEQPVLTCGGVEHEQHLRHVARIAIGDASDLLQLLDEVELRV